MQKYYLFQYYYFANYCQLNLTKLKSQVHHKHKFMQISLVDFINQFACAGAQVHVYICVLH